MKLPLIFMSITLLILSSCKKDDDDSLTIANYLKNDADYFFDQDISY